MWLIVEKLNIAMFGHKHIPSREGGIEVVVEELATRMIKKGHSITCYNRKAHYLVASKDSNIVKNSYKDVRIKSVFTINCKGLAAMSSSVFAALSAALGKYDIVHIHAEGPAAMAWLPHLFRKRVIVTVHGLDWGRAKWGKFAMKYIKWGEKQAVKYADEIIVLSHGIQEYFRKEYGRETVFIPNGINRPEVQKAREINQWGIDKDSYVLFVGRLVPEKGLRYLIEAWNNVVTEKKLVIVGESSDTDGFANELKNMAGKRVIFTGFQQGKVLEELYSNAYVYCLPSDLEGMPLSLLEAMSYGNCCLVSDIPECTEVIENKAVVFSKGNVDALKEKLQWLLDRPDQVARYKIGAADFICSKYNWDDVVEKTLSLYCGRT